MTEKEKQLMLEELSYMGVHLRDEQCRQLYKYYELLVEWNEKMNLTGITEYTDVVRKHFADSAALAKTSIFDMNSENLSLIDVGTGAGFPGLVLKILFPNMKVTLLDTLNKRILFLNHVINTLSLQDVSAIHGRAEEYIKTDDAREKYDICVSRAVADMRVLSEYCMPYVKVNGYFVPYKSGSVDAELDSSQNAIVTLGGTVEDIVKFALPGEEEHRSLILIKKSSETPVKYPRKAGIPVKRPL